MSLIELEGACGKMPRPLVAFLVNDRGTHVDPAVVDAFVKVSPVLQRLSEQNDAV